MHRFQKWRDALQLAPDEKTLIALMDDYVKGLPPGVVAALPEGCRRLLANGAVLDVHSAAVTLLHAELAHGGVPESGESLHEIAHTFAAAAVRLSRLRGQGDVFVASGLTAQPSPPGCRPLS
jgi:hypothetical protein